MSDAPEAETPESIHDKVWRARHAPELEAFGTRATASRVLKGARGSTTSTEYWLNEEQALLVSVLSDAPNAPAVRATRPCATLVRRPFLAHVSPAGQQAPSRVD
jgi:hypothetical protein